MTSVIINSVKEFGFNKETFNNLSEKEFTDVIKYFDNKYESGFPEISDNEYDLMFSEFEVRFPESEYLSSVRSDLGEETSALTKVKHSSPMLSTDKAYTAEEIKEWGNSVLDAAEDIQFTPDDILITVTPKLDGLAGRHENGVLATRGDGSVGHNVSHVYDIGVKTINGIKDGNGELVLSKAYFDANLEKDFSHPRNVMVGIVKSDTLSEHSIKTLNDGAAYFYHYDELPSITMRLKDFVNMEEHYSYFTEHLIRKNQFEFPIDGFVVKVDNKELYEHMGYNHRYHYAVLALKEHGEAKDVEVKKIILQVGRTGRITPVIEIEPTLLSGAIVSRVTGHNLRLLQENGIGVGSVIKVVRSGEVIPYVVSVTKPSNKPLDISTCPSCGGDVEQVSDSVFECSNKVSCPAQSLNAITFHFKALDVKNFGSKTVEKILNSGKVSTVSDVYQITHNEYVEMGFGHRQAEVLIESIQELYGSEVDGAKFLSSFGIKGLGERSSKSILNIIDINQLVNQTPSVERISEIENFGTKTATAIVKGLADIREDFNKILSLGVVLKEKIVDEDGVLYGKNIIFTGTMQNKGRKQMEEEAESKGASVQKSVTKKTDMLIYGEKAGSKLEKAKKLGVECLTEEEYMELIK